MAPQQEQKLTAEELSVSDTEPRVIPAAGAHRGEEDCVRCSRSERKLFYCSPTVMCSVISERQTAVSLGCQRTQYGKNKITK